jgi:hypothetical protein
MSTDRETAELTAMRLRAWADLAKRLMESAPTEAVMRETGSGGGHSTPPERRAIRDAAMRVVDNWLARDLATLAALREEGDTTR